MKDVRLLLRDMVAHLRLIARFTSAGRAALMQDEKTHYAVIRAYEIIGEIVKRLPQSVRDPQIDWHKLAGFRDFLAHNYEEVILDFVWTAVEDAPNLRDSIEAIIAGVDSEAE